MSRKCSSVDRRTFISGTWRDSVSPIAPPARGEIASILVQAMPQHLAEVEAAICKLPGCEIHGREPKGKLVVVVDAPNEGAIGATLNTIATTPRVLSAALVFHAIDTG